MFRNSDETAANRGSRDEQCEEDANRYKLIGTAPCMTNVFEMVVKASRIDAPVLIVGETGSGKELVARSIHQIGPRCRNNLVAVDCAAIVPTLIETELFGYVRGAFTGAVTTKSGLFAAAQWGTVFLDEIGDLPTQSQGKLLRVLQEGEIRPVGGTSYLGSNARIIAATNRDLEAAVHSGQFRRDLYYRLNVLTINLPPLRAHKGDIPALVDYFISKYGSRDQDRPELSANALDALMAYNWPGNVRELENCIRRALVCQSGPLIFAEDLPPQILKPQSSHNDEMSPLKELTRQAILGAVANAKGDKMLAARILGIGKTTIYRRLKELEMGDLQQIRRVSKANTFNPFSELEQLGADVQCTSVGIALFDSQLRYQAISNTLASMTGIQAEERIGKTVSEVLDTGAAHINRLLRHVLSTGQDVLNCEYSACTRSGAGRWRTNFFAMKDNHAAVRYIAAVITQIA